MRVCVCVAGGDEPLERWKRLGMGQKRRYKAGSVAFYLWLACSGTFYKESKALMKVFLLSYLVATSWGVTPIKLK